MIDFYIKSLANAMQTAEVDLNTTETMSVQGYSHPDLLMEYDFCDVQELKKLLTDMWDYQHKSYMSSMCDVCVACIMANQNVSYQGEEVSEYIYEF